MSKTEQKITVNSGFQTLESVGIDSADKVRKVLVDGKEINFTAKENKIYFDKITIKKHIIFEV